MNVKKILKQADDKIKANNILAAKEMLRKVYKKNSDNKALLEKLAYLSFKLNEVENAKTYLKKLLAITYDKNFEKNLLMLHLQSEEWEDANKIIKNVLPKEPNNYQLSKHNAYIEGKLKNYNKANQLYVELIQKNSNDVDLYINFGYLLNTQGLYKEAIEIYQNGLKLYPDNYHLIYNVGIVYKNLGEFRQSIDYLKKIIQSNKNDYRVWLTLAGSYLEMNKEDDAFKALNQAAQLNSNHPDLFYQQSIFNQRKGIYDKSIELLKKALLLDSEHIYANTQLGLMYIKIKEYNKAKEFYKYRVFKKNRFINDFGVKTIEKNRNVLAVWEEGVGDTLLYMRLIRDLCLKINSITVIVQEKLYDYLKNNYPEIKILKDSALEEIKLNKIYENYTKINLGSILRYVDDPDKKSYHEKKHIINNTIVNRYKNIKFKNKKLIIGLSWKSSNLDKYKSYDISLLNNIFKNKEYYFVNLQYGDVKEELNIVNKQYNQEIYFDEDLDYYNDIVGLSNLISSCDLVITCSNITAHLAGALHIKTYLLLPKEIGALWYWYADDYQSSWYPTIKIIRQKTDGEWDSVFKIIKEKLDKN